MNLCKDCHKKSGCGDSHPSFLPGEPCPICGSTTQVSVDCHGPVAGEVARLTDCVARFGRLMLARLVSNIYKGGWQGCNRGWLFRRALEECG